MVFTQDVFVNQKAFVVFFGGGGQFKFDEFNEYVNQWLIRVFQMIKIRIFPNFC